MSLNEILQNSAKPWLDMVADSIKLTNSTTPLIFQKNNSGNTGTMLTANLTGNRTYTLPDGSGTLAFAPPGGTIIGAANNNLLGVGVYDSEVAGILEFRGVAPGSSKVTTTLDASHDILVDVVPANINIQTLANGGGSNGDILQNNGTNFVDSATLNDSSGAISVDYKNRRLDATGKTVVDFGAQQLNDSTGGNLGSLNWTNRQLFDNTGALSIDYSSISGVSIKGLRYPAADGLNGYVVTTNGSGVLSLQPNMTPSVTNAQTFFQGPQGSDSNIGSADFPFLTIAHANSVIAALNPTTATRYTLFMYTQVNNETFNVLANVDYVGDSEFNCQLNGTVNIWNDSSWNNTNDNRSVLQSLRVTGTATLNGSSSATSCKLYVYNCRFNNAMNATSAASGDVPQYEAQGCHFFGTNTITGVQANCIGCEIAGVSLASGSLSDSSVSLVNSTVTGNVSSTRTANNHSITTASTQIQGTLSTTGTNTSLTVTSLPTSLSLSASTTISYLNGSSSFTETWQGPFASAQSGNLQLLLQNGQVTMRIPSFSAATTSSSTISAVTALPAIYTPTVKQISPLIVISGGTTQMGSITINTDGTMIISNNVFTSSFPTSGSLSGVPVATTVSYLL